MKRYEMLLSGDGKAFAGQYDGRAVEALLRHHGGGRPVSQRLDYKKAYDLSFARATLQKLSMITLSGVATLSQMALRL